MLLTARYAQLSFFVCCLLLGPRFSLFCSSISLLDYYFSLFATRHYLFAIHYLMHASRYSQSGCSFSSLADRCTQTVDCCSLLTARNSFLATFFSLGRCRVLCIWSRLLASCLPQLPSRCSHLFLNARSSLLRGLLLFTRISVFAAQFWSPPPPRLPAP